MRNRAFMALILAALTILLLRCTGPVVYLPTPTGYPPVGGLPAETTSSSALQPSLLERRLIILEWPQKVREKDSTLIWLTIAADEQGDLTATAQSGGKVEPLPLDIPNIYDTHNLVAEARLDMAGVEAYQEESREVLRPGQEVTFRWSIRASDAGLYRGVVWLHLELVPLSGGPVERQLLMARPIEVQAVSVFGLPGELARGLGVTALVASTVLVFPFIQHQVENWLKIQKKMPPPPPPGAGEKAEPGEVQPPET